MAVGGFVFVVVVGGGAVMAVEDALPAGGSGDGEVAGARGCGVRRCGGRGRRRHRLSVGEEAQGAGDAVEEGVC